MSSPFTVGAFGMLTWDQILQVDSYPEPGRYQVVRNTVEQSGGTTGNVSVALARLGVSVSLASRVGDDDLGERLRMEMAAEGCEVEHVLTRDGTPTDRGTIIVSGSGERSERTILWVQGARLKHGDHLPIETFFARDLVLVDVDDPRLRLLLLDLPMHVSPRTRIFGTLTFLTELSPAQGFELALRHDFLSGNVQELRHISDRANTEDAILALQREMVLSQVRFAAISDGPRGCYLITRDEVLEEPAFAVDALDPTGAGDAFAAGVMFGILNRWDLRKTGRFANAMGGLATRGLGARTSLPTREEIESFLERAAVRALDEGDHTGD